ncbi:DoxX family protein [Georgenia halophila]|uniref:DoxX family protein n=1 Tax=Georgenia halophila TaxID=620889 RepID=A0ABP8L4U7_9MICO
MEFPDPVWPVIVLALIQLVDGLLSVGPVTFVARCFNDVGFPRRYWRLAPLVKLAATVGLVLGVWVPYLAFVTSVALVAYFVVAISFHVRARDFGRNLFVNATGMLLICLAVTVFCFLV